MKIIVLTIVFLVLTPLLGLKSVAADSVFDRYKSNISWNEETAHLDNFASFLGQNPEYIGYIFVFTNEAESTKKSQSRANRALKYLTKNLPIKYRIQKSRIVVIYKTKSEKSEVILQPIHKNLPQPDFN
jgi:hypothetical protein